MSDVGDPPWLPWAAIAAALVFLTWAGAPLVAELVGAYR